MDITLTPELEAALDELARLQGVSPRDLALDALRDRFLNGCAPPTPTDQWERTVMGVATDCGVSLPHSELSSEGLYD